MANDSLRFFAQLFALIRIEATFIKIVITIKKGQREKEGEKGKNKKRREEKKRGRERRKKRERAVRGREERRR